MTNMRLAQLAHDSAMWYNAVIVQGRRFLDALGASHGQEPWEDGSSIFPAEKMFLITAIHHAICHLERMNQELKKRGNISFCPLLAAIISDEERERIQEWRNMNEHDVEYLAGEGRKQGNFVSTVEKDGYTFQVNASLTFLHGDIGVFMIGNIEIDKLLLRFKNNQSTTLKKLEEVFSSALIAGTNEAK